MPPSQARRALRGRARSALAALPLERALRLLRRWPGVLVLNHHRIGDSRDGPWDPAMFSATRQELDSHLATLARLTHVIGPHELHRAVHAEPGRRVLLTFDDGYRDNHDLALPLLAAHGLTATFFLATGFLDQPRAPWWDEIAWIVRHAEHRPGGWGSAGTGAGGGIRPAGGGVPSAGGGPRPTGDAEDTVIAALVARHKALPAGDGERFLDDLARDLGSGRCPAEDAAGLWMTWDDARRLRAAGMTVGGHTVSHPILARLSPERQREEIAGCATRLREELGEEMPWFAYPVGAPDSFTAVTAGLLREAGVELAFSYYGGFARPRGWDPLDVPRVHVDAALGARLLAQRYRP